MDNFGSMNLWSFMTMHWKGEPDSVWPGGMVKVALGDMADTLNPWTEHTEYGWWLMDRAITSLTMVEPENLMNMPFIATDWEFSILPDMPEYGIINGCRVTFWLRQDVTWHDGKPVTAYDCVENMRFMREHQPRRYSDTWTDLVYEEADGPYKFSVYYNQSGIRYADYVAETALLVPRHIIEVVEGYWEDWFPSDNTTGYAGLGLGPAPAEYPWLKQLVGCGPFVYDYYHRSLAEGRVVKYDEFFVNAPVIGSVVGEWKVNPRENYVYQPMIQNVAAMEADEKGALTNVTVDVKVYEDAVLAYEMNGLSLEPWNWTYLEQQTIENASCGPHYVRVEIYDSIDSSLLHNYTHTFVVTIDEDITTSSGDYVDFRVDMRDIGRVAKAFGTYPGHQRWDPICDINHDSNTDMRDIGSIARKFGWTCP
jgi:ABC-type transport system substrate-binding protein